MKKVCVAKQSLHSRPAVQPQDLPGRDHPQLGTLDEHASAEDLLSVVTSSSRSSKPSMATVFMCWTGHCIWTAHPIEENSLNAIKARGFNDALIASFSAEYNLESTNNIVNSSGRRVRGCGHRSPCAARPHPQWLAGMTWPPIRYVFGLSLRTCVRKPSAAYARTQRNDRGFSLYRGFGCVGKALSARRLMVAKISLPFGVRRAK